MNRYIKLSELIKSVSITHKFNKEELVFLNTSDVLEGKILIDHYSKVSELKGQAKKTIKNGDILYSEIRPKNRRYAYVREISNIEDYVVSTKLMVLRNNSKSLDTDYLYHFLTYEETINYLQKRAENRIGSFPQITFDVLKTLQIWFPELITQQKIAKVLSDLDAKIELNNKINQELEAMAKTLYDYWFVQFDFPYEFPKAGTPSEVEVKPYKSSGGKMVYNKELKREIPEGWEAKTLSKLTLVSNDSLNPMLSPDKDFKHYSIPTFDSTKSYGIEKGVDIRSNKFTVNESDILVSKLNPWFSRVIYPIYEEDLICSTEFVVWRTSNTNIKNYLYMIARGEHFILHCTQSATGTSNSHKRVNPTVMMRYQVPFHVDFSQKYGATIDPWVKKFINNQQETPKLKKLKDWLLPMLMNGQVKVR